MPGRAKADNGPPMGNDVERRQHLRQQDRVAIRNANHQFANPDT